MVREISPLRLRSAASVRANPSGCSGASTMRVGRTAAPVPISTRSTTPGAAASCAVLRKP